MIRRRLASQAGPYLGALLTGVVSCTAVLAADMKTVTNSELNYSIAVPSSCRLEEGPGTLEAVCSPDLTPDRSLVAAAASALLLEIDAEKVPADAKSPYGEAEFRQELPEAVCGEAEPTKVRIVDLGRATDGDRTTWSANVVCAEIKFLGLPERTASVRYVMLPTARYRLMTRVPSPALTETQTVRDAFLASFKITSATPQ
jgi:hypothetical protein